MKGYLTLIGVLLFSVCFSQNISSDELAFFASRIDRTMKGSDIGGGIILKAVRSGDNTLIYEYEVPQTWSSYTGHKADMIVEVEKRDDHKVFVQQNIRSQFGY